MERLLYKQLNNIVDVLLIFFAFVATPGMFLSLSRIPSIGFRPEMLFHVFLSLFVVLIALMRRRIAYRLKSAMIIVSLMVIGYSGLFSIGLSSSGRLDIVISIALACLLFNLKAGLALAAFNILTFIVVALLHVKGVITYSIDFNTYNYTAKAWAAAFFNFTTMGVLVVLLIGQVNQQLRKNFYKTMKKKKQLHKEIIQRQVAEEKYKRLSKTDPLTNLYNRRYFFEKAEEEILRSERYNRKLSLILVDADYFKTVNDTYGHQAGDQVLRELACRFLLNLRPTDIACRFGGEEFSLLLPETGIDEAVQVAERLRAAISNKPVSFKDNRIELTCSFGVTERLQNETDISNMVSRADEALYNAKDKGRNTILVS